MTTRKYIPAPVTPDELRAAADPDALLSRRVTAALTGLSPFTLDRWAKVGRFPAPVYLGPQLKRWRAGEVRHWLRGFDHAASGSGSAASISSESR